jgi:cell division protein FtsL
MDESKQKLLILVLLLISGVLIVTNVFFYRKLNTAKQNPQVQAQEDVQSLVEEVGKLILLPDEAPTVATVTDPAQLQGQPFFVNAKTGDKVLIYAAARKAVLYSPSEKRIVEVAPLIIGEAPAANTPAPETPATETPAAQ